MSLEEQNVEDFPAAADMSDVESLSSPRRAQLAAYLRFPPLAQIILVLSVAKSVPQKTT